MSAFEGRVLWQSGSVVPHPHLPPDLSPQQLRLTLHRPVGLAGDIGVKHLAARLRGRKMCCRGLWCAFSSHCPHLILVGGDGRHKPGDTHRIVTCEVTTILPPPSQILGKSSPEQGFFKWRPRGKGEGGGSPLQLPQRAKEHWKESYGKRTCRDAHKFVPQIIMNNHESQHEFRDFSKITNHHKSSRTTTNNRK